MTLARAVIALACLLAAAYLAEEAIDARHVERANSHGLAGDFEGAIAEARRVDDGPAERRALLAEANALHAAGRLEEAADVFARLVRRDPHNWILHSERARVLHLLGDRRGARAALARARELNPRLPRPAPADR